MRFNAPYIPDGPYAKRLAQLGRRLYAIHFSLYDPLLSDARIRLRKLDLQTLIEGLKSLPIPRKYLLANGRFQPAGIYTAGSGLTRLTQQLDQLATHGVLDGIIFSDPYFLKALSDAAPDLASRLEAVPSINFMIDTAEKLDAVLAMVADTGFRPPAKITLDRSLNRRPSSLGRLCAAIRKDYPDLKIELLANEGCLNHCAYRSTHEALIAAANIGAPVDTFRLNRDLGCRRRLNEAPHKILASPFIRPEDLHRYAETADIVKLCGRTLGPAFLSCIVTAYAAGSYDGNLLDLLDAANWMARQWNLPNAGLPEDLMDRLTACEQNCDKCLVCRDLFRQYAQPLPVSIEDYGGRNRLDLNPE